MPLPFSPDEYLLRLRMTREGMAKQGVDLLVVSDPAHMNYLTGYDAWTYQNPQAVLVPMVGEPVWVGRGIDSICAEQSTWLEKDNVVGYADHYSDSPEGHPMEAVAQVIHDRGWGAGRIGYEGDAFYLTPRGMDALKTGLPRATFQDVHLLINWLKTFKSPQEIQYMRQAAAIADEVMRTAVEAIDVGMRECDLAALITKAAISGTTDIVGAWPTAAPYVLSGLRARTPHAAWTDEPLKQGETTMLELGGCRWRYNVGLARTVHLGEPSDRFVRLAGTVQEGLEAALEVVRPGATCHDVWAAWQRVIERAGFVKKSRIGYSIGLNYPPTWRDHTLSLRADETTMLRPNMTLHVICGMWTGDGTTPDDPNYEISETVLVTDTGAEPLTTFTRQFFVKKP